MMPEEALNLPEVVSEQQWRVEREELLEAEADVTRALDELAARRRRLPMARVEKDYVFEGRDGRARLTNLFGEHRQLIVYHFYAPTETEQLCPGCSAWTDNIGRIEHLQARDTTLVLVSEAPQARLGQIQERMGWALPWYSSAGTSFSADFGVTEWAGLSAFLREGEHVYRTFFTNGRDLERLRTDFNLLDLTALGRQEDWEDSPPGWPQTPPYGWWRLHDEYEPQTNN